MSPGRSRLPFFLSAAGACPLALLSLVLLLLCFPLTLPFMEDSRLTGAWREAQTKHAQEAQPAFLLDEPAFVAPASYWELINVTMLHSASTKPGMPHMCLLAQVDQPTPAPASGPAPTPAAPAKPPQQEGAGASGAAGAGIPGAPIVIF